MISLVGTLRLAGRPVGNAQPLRTTWIRTGSERTERRNAETSGAIQWPCPLLTGKRQGITPTYIHHERYILIILILLSPLTVFLQADNLTSPLISIVPRPTQIVPGSGNFTFSAKTAFAVENQEQAAITRNFIDLFTRAAEITPALNVGSKRRTNSFRDGFFF